MNKSLFKRPGTKHFQLVHRSQRDPLINDPDASDRVLKEIDATQAKSKVRLLLQRFVAALTKK